MKKHVALLRTLGALSLTATVLLGSGCASIFNGGARHVFVASQPTGAKISVTKAGSGELVSTGTTPVTILLEPKRGYFRPQAYVVKFELAGYRTAEVAIRPEISGWYFGNILLGGAIGMVIVDPLTGSMWNLTPEKIEQPLSRQQAAMIKSGDGFLVAMVSQLTDGEKASMVRIH